MQSTQTKQFTDVLYAELKTPQRLAWQYKTLALERDAASGLAGTDEWLETDSSTLLFKLIPSGQVTAYRVKVDGAL